LKLSKLTISKLKFSKLTLIKRVAFNAQLLTAHTPSAVCPTLNYYLNVCFGWAIFAVLGTRKLLVKIRARLQYGWYLKDTNISDGSVGRTKWMFCAQGTPLEATSKAHETDVGIILKR